MAKQHKLWAKDIKIVCQWCAEESALEDWDQNTYSQCTNREMRRLYMSVADLKAYEKDSGKFYKCPKCGQWLKGSQLILISDDESIRKLGGEPIIQLTKREDNEEN